MHNNRYFPSKCSKRTYKKNALPRLNPWENELRHQEQDV